MSFAALILAAGASSRMGKPKLLLPWGKTSVIGHLIEQWRAVEASQIAVVLAAAGQTAAAGTGPHRLPSGGSHPQPGSGTGNVRLHSMRRPVVRVEADLAALGHRLGGPAAPATRNTPRVAAFGRGALRKRLPVEPGGTPAPSGIAAGSGVPATRQFYAGELERFFENLSLDLVLDESDDAGLDLDIDHPADYDKAFAYLTDSGKQDGARTFQSAATLECFSVPKNSATPAHHPVGMADNSPTFNVGNPQ